jgi:hypothetical protein
MYACNPFFFFPGLYFTGIRRVEETNGRIVRSLPFSFFIFFPYVAELGATVHVRACVQGLHV